MIIDSSAILAVILGEAEAKTILEAIEGAEELTLSAATWVETSIVIDRRNNPVASRLWDEMTSSPSLLIEPFTHQQAQIARRAYREYGKGSRHPAQLNMGDCFAYALAKDKGEPLLYKGTDFGQTDVRSALD